MQEGSPSRERSPSPADFEIEVPPLPAEYYDQSTSEEEEPESTSNRGMDEAAGGQDVTLWQSFRAEIMDMLGGDEGSGHAVEEGSDDSDEENYAAGELA